MKYILDTLIYQNMINENAILDAKTSQETFQHGSDWVKENVEVEKGVHSQNGVLDVNVWCDLVKEHTHE